MALKEADAKYLVRKFAAHKGYPDEPLLASGEPHPKLQALIDALRRSARTLNHGASIVESLVGEVDFLPTPRQIEERANSITPNPVTYCDRCRPTQGWVTGKNAEGYSVALKCKHEKGEDTW